MPVKVSKWVFGIAGISGLALLLPLYFKPVPSDVGAEYYYGFIGVGSAWQIAFLFIASNPGKYHIMMIPSALEKLTFAGALFLLHSKGAVLSAPFAAAFMDTGFAALFLIAFFMEA